MVVLAAVVVIGTLAAMASGKVPPVLALAVGLALGGLLQLAPVSALASGLSNEGVITVAGMLVLAKGIVKTGVIARAAWLLLASVTTATAALRRLIVPVGVASALMNTTPLVAMLIPASEQLQQTRRIPAREVLLPIAHSTTLAGSVTLIGTSSNLLIAGIAVSAGTHVDMLSFAPVALPVCLVGWVFLLLFGPRRLKGQPSAASPTMSWRVEISVAAGALAVGKRASALGIARTQEFVLESIVRGKEDVDTGETIQARDQLVFAASEAGVTALWGSPLLGHAPQRLYLVSVGTGEYGHFDDLEVGDLEIIGAQTTRSFDRTAVLPGAAVFVTCAGDEELADHEAFTVWSDVASRAPQPRKTWTALTIMFGVVVAASFGLAPVALAAFCGAILMVVTGVLTPRSAARALDWNLLFILAGSVGLGAIVLDSGLAAELARGIERFSGGNTTALVVVLALTTTVLTNLVTNAAAASILTPIVLGLAAQLSLDPVILLGLVATCISFTFINPFSHQSNLMVIGPGGYSTRTFVRFGLPLVAVAVVAVCVTAWALLTWL